MGKMGMWCRVQCGAGGGFPDVADEKGKVCVRPISLLMSHIGKTTGGPAGMCPPGPMAAHGHVNGWRGSRRQPTWWSVSEVFRENRSSGATGRNIVKAVCP